MSQVGRYVRSGAVLPDCAILELHTTQRKITSFFLIYFYIYIYISSSFFYFLIHEGVETIETVASSDCPSTLPNPPPQIVSLSSGIITYFKSSCLVETYQVTKKII